MGCTQTSASVKPYNHVPIERLYNNEGYSTIKPSPVVMITAPPIPSYVKSVLKKPHHDETGRTKVLSIFTRKPPLLNRQVNFDEQVLVKPRTPTPNKVWYEKTSSTMPMRRHPRNDDDDDDYDDEEITSVSSREEQMGNEEIDSQSSMPTIGSSTSSLQQNQRNDIWYKPNIRGFMPLTNTTPENESVAPIMQQSYNINTHKTSNSITSPATSIKVRRKLLNPDPSQSSFPSSSHRPLQLSATSLYQSPKQSSIVPVYQPFAPASFVPSHQSSVQYPPVPSFQTPVVSFYQTPRQTSATPAFSQVSAPISSVLSSQTPQLKRTVPLMTGESFPHTAFHTFSRHPIENSI